MRIEALTAASNAFNENTLHIHPLFEYQRTDATIERFIALIHIPGLDIIRPGQGLTIDPEDFRGLAICRKTHTFNDRSFPQTLVEGIYRTYKRIDRLDHHENLKHLSIFFG